MKRILANSLGIVSEDKRKKIALARYLLPNMFTTANIFCGFFAVIRSIEGFYAQAAVAVLAAAVFDLFDGRIARLTKTTSEFGVQYDTLADLVSFALAPAVLMFSMGLKELGRIGWALCFMYFIGGALRLARFNVQTHKLKSKDFVGLPSPLAALFVVTFVLLFSEGIEWNTAAQFWMLKAILTGLTSHVFLNFSFILMSVGLGLLMISNFRYHSFKDTKSLKKVRPFYLLSALILTLVLLISQYELFGFVVILVYVLHGPVLYAFYPEYRKPLPLVDQVDKAFEAVYENSACDDDDDEDVEYKSEESVKSDKKESVDDDKDKTVEPKLY